jgi:hypothetical protein
MGDRGGGETKRLTETTGPIWFLQERKGKVLQSWTSAVGRKKNTLSRYIYPDEPESG